MYEWERLPPPPQALNSGSQNVCAFDKQLHTSAFCKTMSQHFNFHGNTKVFALWLFVYATGFV